MSTKVQVVIDCADPDRLITFWAEALGYEIQFPTGSEEERRLLAEHPGLEGSAAAAIDREGVGPRFFLQRVPEPKTVKNRMHVDLRVSDINAEADRLTTLGGSVLRAGNIGEFGERWTVMADPEGNEFCLTEIRPPS
ncbi:MAG TPA: VOC family protein [Actinomycetota bacterium]|jgi:predicted enzyme related to lactoylglutathione lyase|nr:VOC family protein [Actinomycetota bacterium]